MRDPIAIGLGSLACGAGLGGGTIVAALVIVRGLESLHQGVIDFQESAADPVLAGTFAGLAVAAGFGWRRSRALDNVWQRGVIGVLSAVGALILAFLALPVDRLLGFPSLIGWCLVAFAVGVLGSLWAVKGSREDAVKGNGP